MDRQNVKPNRPSLLANGDASATGRDPGAGRILADVEQGGSRRTTVHGVHRRPMLVMAAVAVLALGGYFAWSVSDNASRPGAAQAPSSSTASSSPSPLPGTADAQLVEPASPSAAADTAAIIDTDNPFDGRSVPTTPGRNPFGEAAGAQRPVKRANPFATAPASGKRPESAGKRAVPVTETKAATHRSASAKVTPPTPAVAKNKGDETALGSSLLSNIVTAEAAPLGAVRVAPVAAASVSLASPVAHGDASATAAEGGLTGGAVRSESKLIRPLSGSDHEALDSLIQQVDAQQRAGADEPLARAEKLQRDLRRCPQANTTAGIDCRLKACRDYGDKDAACAVKH